MKNFSFFAKFSIYVYTIAWSQNFINIVKIMRLYSILQLLFTFENFILDYERPTNWSFFFFTIMTFEDPKIDRAIFAEELFTGFTKVSNILEIKLRFTVWILTSFGFLSADYQFFCFRLCCQIQWWVSSCIFYINVNSSG